MLDLLSEAKTEEPKHETRANGWCFCDECSTAREEMRAYEEDDVEVGDGE